MSPVTRKEFIQTSALAIAGLVVGSSFDLLKKNPLLSFSTLGCPDWTFPQITSFAVQHGYKGIELRGLQRQMDLTLCPEFNTKESRKATMALMKEKGLQFVNLGSSANLHIAEGAEREKNLAEAKRFIDLAHQIHCPYVRVFPNSLPKEEDKKATIDRIVKGLSDLGAHAKEKDVIVLMETHGDVVKIDDLLEIMHSAEHPNVGLVWDVCNMWTITKEPPAEAYRKLKKYIHHTHIKDAKLVDGKPQYTLLGQGEVPIFEAIDALTAGGYKGYFSFEWEKLWHPEIAAPEIALADYPKAMNMHFENSKAKSQNSKP
jgi:sugar phosphate isomerase/epimerase